MIDFNPITPDDKTAYDTYLFDGKERGCEFSFVNVYSWGQQRMVLLHDHIALFATFYGRSHYPYPLGQGDKKPVLDAILADAKERGISCRITGLLKEDRETLEKLYPGKFCFGFEKDSLADLKGRKYHRKRNHFKRFQTAFPDYRVEPLTEDTLPLVFHMIDCWYKQKAYEHPGGNYALEQAALYKTLRHYKELGMEGLLLFHKETLLAVTLGSRVSSDTFDVHFEKARADVEGAYTAINCEFARYIRNKYPEIKYLNREEDMGIPGLRKAKESYFPHHQIEKYRAYPMEELHVGVPCESHLPNLRNLWKESFGDTDEFLNSFYSLAFSPSRSRIITMDEKVIAALYWFDCEYENKRIAYVYGVSVAEAFRGQGFGRRLLEETHAHLASLCYEGIVLVPNGQRLFEFYEKFGYQTSGYVNEFEITAEMTSCADANDFLLHEINKEEFAALRRKFLPKHSVIQEKENLDFLEAQAKFYAGEDFVMAAYVEEQAPIEDEFHEKILHCAELLGNASHASKIMQALGCTKVRFRTPGKEIPFAMYHSLTNSEFIPPQYFGLAFD